MSCSTQKAKGRTQVAFASSSLVDTYNLGDYWATFSAHPTKARTSIFNYESILRQSFADLNPGGVLQDTIVNGYGGAYSNYESLLLGQSPSLTLGRSPGTFRLSPYVVTSLWNEEEWAQIAVLPISAEDKINLAFACTYAQTTVTVDVVYACAPGSYAVVAGYLEEFASGLKNLKLIDPSRLASLPVLA